MLRSNLADRVFEGDNTDLVVAQECNVSHMNWGWRQQAVDNSCSYLVLRGGGSNFSRRSAVLGPRGRGGDVGGGVRPAPHP